MLAQTNLQLYHQLLAAQWSARSLVQVRAAYDRAAALFAGYYRPSGRPFVCHLIGTASCLAAWGLSPAVVTAGLLHSAYLYGDFADGARRVTPERRVKLAAEIGAEAETLIFQYGAVKQAEQISHWMAAPTSVTSAERPLAAMLLADLCDECHAAEPSFAPRKRYEGALPWNSLQRAESQELARHAVGEPAAEALRQGFLSLDLAKIPTSLLSTRSSYYRLKPTAWWVKKVPRQLSEFVLSFQKKRVA